MNNNDSFDANNNSINNNNDDDDYNSNNKTDAIEIIKIIKESKTNIFNNSNYHTIDENNLTIENQLRIINSNIKNNKIDILIASNGCGCGKNNCKCGKNCNCGK
jgi:hypothetical protein